MRTQPEGMQAQTEGICTHLATHSSSRQQINAQLTCRVCNMGVCCCPSCLEALPNCCVAWLLLLLLLLHRRVMTTKSSQALSSQSLAQPTGQQQALPTGHSKQHRTCTHCAHSGTGSWGLIHQAWLQLTCAVQLLKHVPLVWLRPGCATKLQVRLANRLSTKAAST